MNYQFLCDYPENLENQINFLLDFQQFSWDKIYIFSAFVSDYGVKKVEQIISDDSLNENTEVGIAIGKKTYDINKPIYIQTILDSIKIQNQNNFKTKPIRFICPKNDGFHIKAYCFLGCNKKGSQTQIGYSIVGSSNLTKFGFKGKGELCISIDNLELTQKLIARLSDKYIINNRSSDWDKEIEKYKIEYDEKRQEEKYKDKQSRQDQNEVLPPFQENSTPVNQNQQPILNRRKGKFIKLGVLTDNDLITKATNLANDSENIDCFYSSPKTLEQAKDDFPERSLCLLLMENKKFQLVEIISYEDDKQQTQGCFTRFKFNVEAFSYDDIREIVDNEEEYKKIKIAEEDYEKYRESNQYPELEYATLNMFENKVKEYQKLLADPNYKKWLEKGEEKMQSKIDGLLKEIEKIDDPSLKERLKKLL